MRAALLTLSTLLALSTLQAGCSKKQTNQNGASASPADNAAQESSGGDARSFFERGMDAHKNDRDEEAVEDFKQAVQFDPDFAEGYYRLGVVQHITGQTDEAQKSFEAAIKAYEKLTKQDPKNSDAYYFMALSYERLDKYEEAVRALKDAVRTSPKDDDDKYYELALAHFKLAQYDESVAALNKALEINPDNYPAQDLLEKAKAGAERVAEIRRHQEQLLKQKNANQNANSNANAGANANTNAAANGNKNDAPSPLK